MWVSISNRSQEYELHDLMNEAWEFACSKWKKGEVFNIDDESDWKYLYGVIDKKLVQYTEKNIKYAVRIDQSYSRNSFEENAHPILKTLFADEDLAPLNQLEQLEQQQEYEQKFSKQVQQLGYSKIAAFLQISHSFNTSRVQTAHALNMSYSWFYTSGQVFQKLYSKQRSLFDDLKITVELEELKIWRKFKEIHIKNTVNKNQLCLSFHF